MIYTVGRRKGTTYEPQGQLTVYFYYYAAECLTKAKKYDVCVRIYIRKRKERKVKEGKGTFDLSVCNL